MEIRKLDENVAIMGQPTPGAVEDLKRSGFAAMICNRPDDEGPGQPPYAEIAAEAARFGMQARNLPVVPGKITQEDGAAFAVLLAELPKPIIAYCRTGNRSESGAAFIERLAPAPHQTGESGSGRHPAST